MVNRRSRLLLVFGFAVFLLNSMIRNIFFHVSGITLPGMLGSANWIAIIAEISMLNIIVQNARKKSNMSSFLPILLILYTILVSLTNIDSNNTVGHWMLFASIFPAIILQLINFDNVDTLKLFKKFLISFNFLMGTILFLGVIDFFLGGVVNKFIKNYLYDDSFSKQLKIENETYKFRMFTVFGTPLMNAFYAIVMLSLNAIYKRITGKEVGKQILINSVSLLAIFATGSRAALFLGVLIILFSEFYDKFKLANIILLQGVFFILINTSLFQDTVGNRIGLGFNNDSDARYQLFEMFTSGDFGVIKFFSGGGYNFSRVLTASVDEESTFLNFEYPILMFLYDYGILATLLYYVIFLILPIRNWLSHKQYYIVTIYCILFAFLQTCNLSAQFYDFNLQLGFIIVIISQSISQLRDKRFRA